MITVEVYTNEADEQAHHSGKFINLEQALAAVKTALTKPDEEAVIVLLYQTMPSPS